MKPPEELFRAARLAPPSADLDRRMQAILAATPPRPRRWPAWRWAGLLAATGAAAAVIAIGLGHRRAGAAAAAATYEIEPRPVVREWLLGSPGNDRPPGRFDVKVTPS